MICTVLSVSGKWYLLTPVIAIQLCPCDNLDIRMKNIQVPTGNESNTSTLLANGRIKH